MTSPIRLHIDTIAAGGDGIGRLPDGMVVFVPRTAVGDEVIVDLKGKGRFARGTLREIVTPSPQRVDPPCPHYVHDHCGGCQLQHIDDGAQRAIKSRTIADAFERIAKRPLDTRPDIAPSPASWRYRSKLTLAIRNTSRGWIAGLHAYDNPSRIFPLRDCLITDERIMAVWHELLANARFFPKAAAFRASVRWTDAGAVCVMHDIDPASWHAQSRLFESTPSLVAMAIEYNGERTIVGDRRNSSSGDTNTMHRTMRQLAAFAQVNPDMAAILKQDVQTIVRERAPRRIIDAYAGYGDLSLALIPYGITSIAIELDPEGAGYARSVLPSSCEVIQGKVEDTLSHVLSRVLPADLIVANPPRAGLHEHIPEILNASGPADIVYISCDPATLARDVGRLTAYKVTSVRGYDMFPQTAHVETVCVLQRTA